METSRYPAGVTTARGRQAVKKAAFLSSINSRRAGRGRDEIMPRQSQKKTLIEMEWTRVKTPSCTCAHGWLRRTIINCTYNIKKDRIKLVLLAETCILAGWALVHWPDGL